MEQFAPLLLTRSVKELLAPLLIRKKRETGSNLLSHHLQQDKKVQMTKKCFTSRLFF